jgi:5,5'-dehydrodivanillate O-demethylase
MLADKPTLHHDLYRTGPGTLAGRYMRKFWHPVYAAENLKPGWAKPIRIMGEDFTLYRGETGTPHVVGFRCAHRDAQLSVGWVEGDCIRCRFHGWKYDASGQCIEQPAERRPFAEHMRIASYPAEEYLGLIFAYLGEGEPPTFPRYPDFEGSEIWVETYVRPCNFFNNLENEPFHIPFTHRESQQYLKRPVEIPEVFPEESDWGVLTVSKFATGRVHVSHHGMPNVLCFKEGDRDHLAWRVPIDDHQHASFQVDVQHVTEGERGRLYRERHAARTEKAQELNELAQAVLRGDIRIPDIEDKSYIHWIQDYVIQVGQSPIEQRRECLGDTDEIIILQRKIWEREIKALAEGKPTKQWTRTRKLAEMRSSG